MIGLLLSLALFSVPASGMGDAETTLAYAQQLASQKDYYRAITEYRRFAYLAGDDRSVDALETAGWLALEGGQFEEARRLFEHAIRVSRELKLVASDEISPRVRYARGALWDEQGFDIDAAGEFEAAAADATDAAFVRDARWRAAWAHFDHRLSLAGTGAGSRRLADAMKYIGEFEDDPVHGADVRRMLAQAGSRKLRYRPPLAAGITALIVPGSGFLIAGQLGPALASFILNGLFIGAITWAITQQNYALAAVALGLEVGWYFGGASGSAQAAADANQRVLREAQKSYRDQFFGEPYSQP